MALKLTDTAIAAVLAASLVACGGSESSESTAPAAEAAADAAAEVESAAAEATDTVVEAAGDAADAVTDTVEAAADEAADVVEAAAEEATDAVETVADEIEEVVPTAGEDTAAGGQTYEVQMLNADPNDRSQRMVFEPAILSVQPGDTVTWVPTDLTHLAASTRGMLPEGVEGWQGRVNQPVSYTFEQPGIYGYNCTPHQAAGMVGLVVVEGDGKLDNLEAAKAVRHPGLAARRWDAIWTEAEAQGLLSE